MLLYKIYMSIVQNPDAHYLLERVMANCAHFVAYSNILADPIGQAQFPHRHITRHNGLYLAHSIIHNGFTPL
jgi:hypothetical protein